jgi:hypothetical protein
MPAKAKPPAKIIFAPTPGRQLKPEEVAAIIGRLSRSDEQWNALYHVMQRRLMNAAVDSSDPRLSDREAGHAGGRVSEILDLMGELSGYLDAATKPKG